MALSVQEVFQQNKVRPDLTFVILVGQRKQPAFGPSLYVTKKQESVAVSLALLSYI